MLGAILAAAFLVMTHHLKEISLLFLEETAPSVLLTCLSFLPRLSRLPHATCNKMLASVLVRLSQMLQLGQPSSTARVSCAASSALTIQTWQSPVSLFSLRTHRSRGPQISLLAHFTFLSVDTYQTA